MLGGFKVDYKNIINSLESKITKEDTGAIESDIEYYVALGQGVKYLYNISPKKHRNGTIPFTKAKSIEQLKERFRNLFKENMVLINGNTKINNLFAMVFGYIPESKIDEFAIDYGFFHRAII
jgi:hypothetical protein